MAEQQRKQKTQPKGIDPKTGKPFEPIEIPPLKRGTFEGLLRRAAKGETFPYAELVETSQE